MDIEVMAESTSPLPLSLRLVIKLLDSKASQTCSFLPSIRLMCRFEGRKRGDGDLYDRLRITALMTNTRLKYADRMSAQFFPPS
jgi:hypothetical protein